MPIKAKNPVTKPAETFDNVWLQRLEVEAPNVGGNATASIKITYYSDAGSVGPSKTIYIDQVLQKIQSGDQKLAAAYEAIMAVVAELEGQENG